LTEVSSAATPLRLGPRNCGQSAASNEIAEFDETKAKTQIINRKSLIKAVLKGKNISRIRPLNHPQKKENYECVKVPEIKIFS